MVKVAVIGSGLAGLAAALFLSRRGHSVHVIERDADDLSTRVDGAWFRRGVGQAGQTHAFLALSSRVMAQEAPDVLEALEAAGAFRRHSPLLACADDPAPAQAVYERRLAYEAVLREAVKAEPTVRLELAREVTGLMATHEGPVPRVVGVQTQGGDVPADLVVDASGRRSAVARWLAGIGARPPVQQMHPCGFHYLTRWYRVRPGCEFPPGPLPVPGRTHFGSFLLCAAGAGQFSLSLGLSDREPHRAALRDAATFDRFALAIPRLAAWVQVGEGLGEPQAYAGIDNGRRSLVDEQGAVVHGLALLGDAALHTNPTLGRGASLAFAHAQQLARSVESAAAQPARFIEAFEGWTREHLGEWFDTQVAIDAEMTQRFHALAEERPLPAWSERGRRSLALGLLAEQDPQVASTLLRMMSLLQKPSAIAADEQLSARIAHVVATREDLDERREGVTRSEFAAWVPSAPQPPQ